MSKNYETAKQVALGTYRGFAIVVFVCGFLIVVWEFFLSIGTVTLQRAFLTVFLPYFLLVNLVFGLLEFKSYMAIKKNEVSPSYFVSARVPRPQQALRHWVVMALIINVTSPSIPLSAGFRNFPLGTQILDLLIIAIVYGGSLVAPIYLSIVEKKKMQERL